MIFFLLRSIRIGLVGILVDVVDTGVGILNHCHQLLVYVLHFVRN